MTLESRQKLLQQVQHGLNAIFRFDYSTCLSRLNTYTDTRYEFTTGQSMFYSYNNTLNSLSPLPINGNSPNNQIPTPTPTPTPTSLSATAATSDAGRIMDVKSPIEDEESPLSAQVAAAHNNPWEKQKQQQIN